MITPINLSSLLLLSTLALAGTTPEVGSGQRVPLAKRSGSSLLTNEDGTIEWNQAHVRLFFSVQTFHHPLKNGLTHFPLRDHLGPCQSSYGEIHSFPIHQI